MIHICACHICTTSITLPYWVCVIAVVYIAFVRFSLARYYIFLSIKPLLDSPPILLRGGRSHARCERPPETLFKTICIFVVWCPERPHILRRAVQAADFVFDVRYYSVESSALRGADHIALREPYCGSVGTRTPPRASSQVSNNITTLNRRQRAFILKGLSWAFYCPERTSQAQPLVHRLI